MVAEAVRRRVRKVLERPGSADLEAYRPHVEAASGHEDRVRALSDDELAPALREALPDLANRRRTDWIAPYCAVAREAARRALDVRMFDEQLLGVVGLLRGTVVEMATGEGKTLCESVAAAGFAAAGRSVHVLSANDYLARRDRDWMAGVHRLLGVSSDWVEQAHDPDRRRDAYTRQIVYGAATEVGFDVLRDRLVTDPERRVGPVLDVGLVDEIDSVLIDEARTPLVLAGAAPGDGFDPAIMKVVRRLRADRDYKADPEGRTVSLTDDGSARVERALGGIDLYTEEHAHVLAAVHVGLYADVLLHRDVDYLVRDGAVELVDHSRGRVSLLQRWPDGIQAAIECKEGVRPSESGEVLDSTTLGNLVSAYDLVAGMSGTAVGVADELREFHELEVAVVPPHRPCIREDLPDRLFADAGARRDAAVDRIRELHEQGRPVLVGTQDVAASEELALALRSAGLEPAVLNARNDSEEAAVIAEAGRAGRVTVSTQMAGRGTDIRLGDAASDGSGEAVADLGGLHVLGYGRHPARRLDDQLRGRAGRQGDPGTSEFYVSLDDPLLTRFGEDVPADPHDPNAGAAVDRAQRVAQAEDLQIHRGTRDYHHLLAQQRTRVLEHREKVLRTGLAAQRLAELEPDQHAKLLDGGGADIEAEVEHAARLVWLDALDRRWSEHLGYLGELREGIHLRGLARGLSALSPLDEFHRDAMAALSGFSDDVESRAAETWAGLTTSGGAVALEPALRRPSATWTYLVTDNPYGSEAERALRGLVEFVGAPRRSGRPPSRAVAVTLGVIGIAVVLAVVALLTLVG